jgi:hypothetical protein
MPGLVPGIHALLYLLRKKNVDGRDKPGHDDKILIYRSAIAKSAHCHAANAMPEPVPASER